MGIIEDIDFRLSKISITLDLIQSMLKKIEKKEQPKDRQSKEKAIKDSLIEDGSIRIKFRDEDFPDNPDSS